MEEGVRKGIGVAVFMRSDSKSGETQPDHTGLHSYFIRVSMRD